MKVTENKMKYGILFTVSREPGKTHPSITAWLFQNDIQHIFTHSKHLEDQFFIRDEAGIMAFKLRWI